MVLLERYSEKENEQGNYYHSQPHSSEHEHDYLHISKLQTGQIRYTSDQLYKFGKPSAQQKLTMPLHNHRLRHQADV